MILTVNPVVFCDPIMHLHTVTSRLDLFI